MVPALDSSTVDGYADDLAAFLAASPSPFHAVAAVAERLRAAGFAELVETEEWPTDAGARFVVRDGAIIAWVQPASASATTPFRILGAHTDSPTLTITPSPAMATAGWRHLNVEVYGGPILTSWFDRDLRIAGRIAFADGRTRLVETGAIARIPNLAIHLDRTVNEGRPVDRQRHLPPIVGIEATSDAGAWLAALAGPDAGGAVGWELGLADAQPPARIGVHGDLLAAGRMDNLVSVHAGLRALAVAPRDTAHIPMLAAFDHEEVGSASRSGAAGPFLGDVLGRIGAGLGASASDAARSFAASWLLSSDAGHAVHPNFPEKHDPTNRPVPGAGPLLKINGSQRYATDALGSALWADVCARAGVPFQTYVNLNTIPGGSTIGPLAATRLGIRTVDVGVPLLSMHSIRELVHLDDAAALVAAAAGFLAG